LILNSVNVIPKKLSDAGFKYSFPDINKALHDLLRRR